MVMHMSHISHHLFFKLRSIMYNSILEITKHKKDSTSTRKFSTSSAEIRSDDVYKNLVDGNTMHLPCHYSSREEKNEKLGGFN